MRTTPRDPDVGIPFYETPYERRNLTPLLASHGILREAAQRLVQAALPSPTTTQRREAIQGVIRELHARGITS